VLAVEGSVAAASAEGVGLGVSLTVGPSGDIPVVYESIDIPKGRSTCTKSVQYCNLDI